jgi:hypothetical protein
MHTQFWSENLNGRGNLEDLGVKGKMNMWTGFISQDSAQWRALVNIVMNVDVPKKRANFKAS